MFNMIFGLSCVSFIAMNYAYEVYKERERKLKAIRIIARTRFDNHSKAFKVNGLKDPRGDV